MTEIIPDELDRQILQLIVGNARISFLEVARLCNVSGGAVHQRVQKMIGNGIITGAEFIIDPFRVGYESCAYMSLYVDDGGNMDNIVKKLSEIDEVVECHHTSGGGDLFVKIYARNNDHLLEIIRKRLRPLGISRTETMISYREEFRRQAPFRTRDENDEENDDRLQIR